MKLDLEPRQSIAEEMLTELLYCFLREKERKSRDNYTRIIGSIQEVLTSFSKKEEKKEKEEKYQRTTAIFPITEGHIVN